MGIFCVAASHEQWTRQPSAAAEARQISGAQGWEGGGCGGKAPRPRVGGGRDAGGGLAVWRVFGFGRVTVALLREGMGLWIGGGSAACKRIC